METKRAVDRLRNRSAEDQIAEPHAGCGANHQERISAEYRNAHAIHPAEIAAVLSMQGGYYAIIVPDGMRSTNRRTLPLGGAVESRRRRASSASRSISI